MRGCGYGIGRCHGQAGGVWRGIWTVFGFLCQSEMCNHIGPTGLPVSGQKHLPGSWPSAAVCGVSVTLLCSSESSRVRRLARFSPSSQFLSPLRLSWERRWPSVSPRCTSRFSSLEADYPAGSRYPTVFSSGAGHARCHQCWWRSEPRSVGSVSFGGVTRPPL